MNYEDITTIVNTLKVRYDQLDEELNKFEKESIEQCGGYAAFNKIPDSEKRKLVYNSEWHRIIDERKAVLSALEHFREYKF